MTKDDEHNRVSCEDAKVLHSSENSKTLRSPSLSSGRRKRRKPKKLASLRRHRLFEESDDESQTFPSHGKIGDEEMSPVSYDTAGCRESDKYEFTHGSTSRNVEEYPVLILAENGEEELLAGGHQEMSTEGSSPSQVGRIGNEATDDSLYESEIPRISNIKSIVGKSEIGHARVKYTAPIVSLGERDYQNDISTSVFFTEQAHIGVMSTTSSNAYTLIKPFYGYNNSNERSTFVCQPRSSHMISETTTHPYYIITEPNTTNTTENNAQLSANDKVETSQLLLKVSGASSNTPGFSISCMPSSSDDTKQFPITQKAGHGCVEKTSKDDVKLLKNTNSFLTVDGEQRPRCPECFQTFKKRAALERHMMIHRGIKPFQCHFCNQRFRQKHHLQGHIMLHTGERPHSCSLCNKRFRMRHHLLEHERISHKVFR